MGEEPKADSDSKENVTPLGLDERYLGRRLPGDPEQRAELLDLLTHIFRKCGEKYVRENAEQLLKDAQITLDSGMIKPNLDLATKTEKNQRG